MSELPLVLVVDDRHENLVAMRRALSDLSAAIHTASSGQDAVEFALQSESIAVILMDVQMPGMNGFETAEILRLSAATRNIPIIFVTAGGDEIQRVFEGYQIGAVDYLAKPVNEVALKAKVSVFLELARREMSLSSTLAELKCAHAELENHNEALRSFVSNMSHEIRTPLNGIVGVADLLHDIELPDEAASHVRTITNASAYLLAVVNKLLDFSKIQGGHVTLEPLPTDLRAHLKTLAELMAPVGKVPLIAEIGDDVPHCVKVDPVRLKQVLTNLTSNALKFTEKGQVTLRVSRVSGDEEQVRLRFEVEDSGDGIPADAQSRIFSAFKQASVSTTRTHGGTGLGLSISSSIVNLMGSEIELTSQVGVGSCFYFDVELPVAEMRRGQSKRAGIVESKGSLSLEGVRVLVADDNKVNLLVARKMLERQGCEVSTAGDGLEAVKRVQEHDYDLVFMDWRMPNLDGLGATQRIRELEQDGQRVVIIGATANSMKEDLEKCIEAGMDDCITKPIRLPALLEVCQRWLPSAG